MSIEFLQQGEKHRHLRNLMAMKRCQNKLLVQPAGSSLVIGLREVQCGLATRCQFKVALMDKYDTSWCSETPLAMGLFFAHVCFSFCLLYVSNLAQKIQIKTLFGTKLCGGLRHGPGGYVLHFGADPGKKGWSQVFCVCFCLFLIMSHKH